MGTTLNTAMFLVLAKRILPALVVVALLWLLWPKLFKHDPRPYWLMGFIVVLAMGFVAMVIAHLVTMG